MQQNEVHNARFLDVLEQHFDFYLTAFADVGLVGYDFQDWRGVPLRLINTYGVGGRLLGIKTLLFVWSLAFPSRNMSLCVYQCR